MNELLEKIIANQNVVGGMACALFAVIVGTRPQKVGWRDYALIVAAAIIATAAVIDYWFLNRGFFIACAIGFTIGYLADDVVLNLNATVPEFVSGSLKDILDWLREWLRRLLNK